MWQGQRLFPEIVPGSKPVTVGEARRRQAARRSAEAGDGRRTPDDWRADELRWLRTQIAELEQQLRRRTVALAVALAFSGLVTVAAAVGGALVLLDGVAEPRWTGRIADDGPARQQDDVVRALAAANEEIEAAIGRLADGRGR